ncbi:MAG: hypothetical protein IT338_06495 [Thermomicrobiales bacterium]|nr:hypothetical protein [Thermomicrobiales bacterium]
MNSRRIAGLFGGAAAAGLAIGAEVAQAQENSGASINLGGNIANTVTNAVSGISTNSSGGGTISGGVQVEHNEMHLGDQEGVAISDASGGNHNVSFVS